MAWANPVRALRHLSRQQSCGKTTFIGQTTWAVNLHVMGGNLVTCPPDRIPARVEVSPRDRVATTCLPLTSSLTVYRAMVAHVMGRVEVLVSM